ncbi:MAG: hypothetical protein ACHREM_10985 [Polyangiales bacterium]
MTDRDVQVREFFEPHLRHLAEVKFHGAWKGGELVSRAGDATTVILRPEPTVLRSGAISLEPGLMIIDSRVRAIQKRWLTDTLTVTPGKYMFAIPLGYHSMRFRSFNLYVKHFEAERVGRSHAVFEELVREIVAPVVERAGSIDGLRYLVSQYESLPSRAWVLPALLVLAGESALAASCLEECSQTFAGSARYSPALRESFEMYRQRALAELATF